MKCPNCRKPVSEKARKCAHCNTVVNEIVARDANTGLKCPLCNLKTDLFNLAGVELDFCHRCTGIWFDRGEMEGFQSAVVEEHQCAEMVSTLNEFSCAETHGQRKTYLPCPVCFEPMLHRNFVQISGVLLDQCPQHGTWVERKNLVTILELLGSGEIDELLRKAGDEEKRQLHIKLMELESRQRALDTRMTRNERFDKVHFALDWLGFL